MTSYDLLTPLYTRLIFTRDLDFLLGELNVPQPVRSLPEHNWYARDGLVERRGVSMLPPGSPRSACWPPMTLGGANPEDATIHLIPSERCMTGQQQRLSGRAKEAMLCIAHPGISERTKASCVHTACHLICACLCSRTIAGSPQEQRHFPFVLAIRSASAFTSLPGLLAGENLSFKQG